MTSVSRALVASIGTCALLLGIAGCATNPLDAAACKAFVTAQNVYDDAANNALTDNTPVNSGLWTAAWKALSPAVTGAARLANGDALKKAFSAYTDVLEANTNAAEAKRLEIWQTGYAQTIMSVCVSTGGAQPDELTPINVP